MYTADGQRREWPVDLAEEALAGAILHEPSRVSELVSWLQPEDFADNTCAAVFEAARRRFVAGDVADVHVLREDIASMDVHARWGEAPRLFELMEACPLHPEPAVYGRMVLEASLRRKLMLLGELVESASLTMAQRGEAGIEAVLNQAVGVVEGETARWDTSQSARPNEVPAERLPLPSAKQPAGELDTAALEHAERVVLASAMHLAGAVEEFAPRLSPRDFADEALGNTYRAAVSLHEQGRHVDVVTVAWEAQRLTPQHGQAMPAGELRRLSEVVTPTVPRRELEVMLSASLHRTAAAARDALRKAAGNPGVTPADLLETAAMTYRAVEAAAGRMMPGGQASAVRRAAELAALSDGDPDAYERPTRRLSAVPDL